MDNEFHPPRSNGILFHVFLIVVLAILGGYFFLMATQDLSGLGFLLNMLIALVIFAPIPLLVYRLYALFKALYGLRREGLMIRWGLRREDIPLSEIEWMRPADELGFRLPLPWLRWPGAILGLRRVSELGPVEFIAAGKANMILVATGEKVFAISPANPNQFLSLFQQMNELGSLAPLEAQSVYPKLLLGRVWEDRLARILILTGFGVGVLLIGIVSLMVPGLETIIWTGADEAAPAERLLLLPILDGMIWLFNFFLGIFLYRRGEDLRIAAYLLWGTAVLTGILLLIGSLVLIL